jgi:hypothetical protein
MPTVRYGGRRVYTNKPACGAMRGHGAVNARFNLETALDELAEQLNCYLEENIPSNVRLVNLEKIIASVGVSNSLDFRFYYSLFDQFKLVFNYIKYSFIPEYLG